MDVSGCVREGLMDKSLGRVLALTDVTRAYYALARISHQLSAAATDLAVWSGEWRTELVRNAG